ncbi:MHC class II transactivator [Lacerta agilis]|uniref:MHC class II transactivator n=1 Tax=Lacerta agilis TaxID=80427 RepID=UPI00141A6243|nr:MHC class II transactivator [Lacerta agilis]
MDLFGKILPGVRGIVCDASPTQIQALLNLMLEGGVISKEYYQTLLHERDREDLARKISLTLVEKSAMQLSQHSAASARSMSKEMKQVLLSKGRGGAGIWKHVERKVTCEPGKCQKRLNYTSSVLLMIVVMLSGDTMDPGVLAGKSYLDLLFSDIDIPVLYKQVVETEPDDQENNPDLFYTVESNESGEQVCLCADTGEAYDKIASLAEYVLKDQQEKPEEDLFGNLVLDEAVAEPSGDAKKRGSCSDAPEPKRRKLGHPPALCVVSGNCIAIPLSCSPPDTLSLPDFHMEFSVTTISPAFEPLASPNLYYCPLGVEDIQVVFAFEPLDQRVNILAGPESAIINDCLDVVVVDKGPEAPPVHSEQAHKRLGPVDAFHRRLKDHFRKTCQFVPMEQEFTLDHLYIERDLALCLVESKNAGKNSDPRPCDLREKRKVAVGSNQIFQLPWKNNLGTKVVAVLGKAGMGKSLLVQKICLDWSRGHLPNYGFLFRFDCRMLGLLPPNHYSLKQLLFELSSGPQDGGDDIYRHVLRYPEKVLLVFDGFEELKDRDGLTPGVDSLPQKEPSGIGGILAGIFQKKFLSGCTVLLTSRPKGKLQQHLSKMDAALELAGFSTQQAESYIARYFESSPCCGETVAFIRDCPYLFSHCYTPDLCRFVCEAMSEVGCKKLPSTLTGLLAKFLLRKLMRSSTQRSPPKHQNIAALAQVAWSSGLDHRNALMSYNFPSTEVKEFALSCGLVVPLAFPKDSSSGKEECGYVFPSFVVQNFLVALHLVLAKEIKDKTLTKYLRLLSKSKKFLSSWSLVPCFLSGLLFLGGKLSSSVLFREEGEMDTKTLAGKKQRSFSNYVRKHMERNFSPDKLLDLLHCLYETGDPRLLKQMASELKCDLSFLGFALTPPNVYILHSVIKQAKRKFALDLRGSAVDSEGFRQLVTLKNVASFRASLSDAVRLWKQLWEAEERDQLQSAIEKFIVVPFKAKTMRDIDDLCALVDMQEKMTQSGADSAGGSIRLIPAVAELKQLEFTLGRACGLTGFRKLVGILGTFPALQHLDLDSPIENEIGDEGVASLSIILPRLSYLEMLNLSGNKITDLGAEKLAKALPSLRSLKTLSLYNNDIGDAGAEHFARVLPETASLRVLDIHCNKITAAGAQHLTDSLRKCPRVQSVALWNPTIPHGLLDHLRQMDSRIRLL